MEHLSKTAAIELAPFNIRVNSVAPGYVETESITDNFSDTLKQDAINRSLLSHSGAPEDLGDAIVYLSSNLSRWVTGQVIGIDGGLNVHVGSDFGELAELVVGKEAMANAGYNR